MTAGIAITDPLSHLVTLLGRCDEASMTSQVIAAARKTVGITADNYLPWRREFTETVLDSGGVASSHMGNRSFVWGYDPDKRIFIAFQYTVTNTKTETVVQEVTTIAQQFSGAPSFAQGIHDGGSRGHLYTLDKRNRNEVEKAFAPTYLYRANVIEEQALADLKKLWAGGTITQREHEITMIKSKTIQGL